jgi:hypothetical protein
MKRLYRLAEQVEDFGGYTSPSFKSFARKFKNSFNKELAKVSAKIVGYTTGHYYVSGFFETKNGNLYYFSISDVRYFDFGEMLYRTAEHLKDFTGGSNQYVTIDDDMVEKMKIN